MTVKINQAEQSYFDDLRNDLHDHMGAHTENGKTLFRFWAPNAMQVYLVGDFNSWSDSLPMKLSSFSGFWESELLPINEGSLYKFKVITKSGEVFFCPDPYARKRSVIGESASVLSFESDFNWQDKTWLENRARTMSGYDKLSRPVSVYQLCPSSWKRGYNFSTLSGEELARELVPYVKQMGYTHVSIECEDNGSSPFADFLYGEANEYRAMIDLLHRSGVGVIQNVPVSPLSQYLGGYSAYDGLECKYVLGLHISRIAYMLKEFHIDGIFLCSECEELIGAISAMIEQSFPDALLILEQNKSDVSEIAFDGGASRAEALRAYLEKDHVYRKYHHDELIRAIDPPSNSPSFIGVSHKDVGMDGRSLLGRMFGSYDEKFAAARAFLCCMMTSRGKKQLSSGCEIGQFKPFLPNEETEWFLLSHQKHRQLQRCASDLNMLYLENKALWDDRREGLVWLDKNSSDISVVSYERTDGNNTLYVIINFTPVYRRDYRLTAKRGSAFSEIFNSDDLRYGGNSSADRREMTSNDRGELSLNLPPLSAIILKKTK